jgi:molybdopterin/thiamine biosynthesis adenylyltransferase
MSHATLVLPSSIASEITRMTRECDEAAAVLLAGLARSDRGLRLLGRELHHVPDHAYRERSPRSLSISSSGYVGALARAEAISAVPIWLHTHPGTTAVPLRSKYDIDVDAELEQTFRIRSGAEVYASMVVSPAQSWVRFSGAVVDGQDQGHHSLDRLYIVGPRWCILAAEDAPAREQLPLMFDRQIRAFGGDVQHVLSALRIGVVGCGGTGSASAEQLVRLGVRSLLLVDPDVLSESNVTRVYGSTLEAIGRPKVEVLAAHLRRIAPGIEIQTVQGTISAQAAAARLRSCDLIFGCTDDNAGRLVLSRFSSYYLTPVIDVGVLLSSAAGALDGIHGRVTVMTPGEGCLVCRDRIDLARAQAEQLDPSERESLQAEGYAPGLGAIEPAVVPYTTLVASLAVAEVIERFVGYGPDPEPGGILARCHDREISTNSHPPRPRHYCDPDAGKLGLGDHTPFLEQTWRG